ncbi:hypothetical protein [Paenibacillus agricola]|uniref:Uncharacterized protein n=1 Tax=Paenibacillus agricola TaxID=2716264 RepID=A0ABX0JAP4_9BACL|nr:hypothetical protein [Paenibacillus agricola]NHN31947.1 hypothetical protein [Paenibacillus agricola]
MSKSMRTAEGFTLHMQWIEQFVREAEQAIEQEHIKTTAQTVLFYAGMHVQLEKQSALQTGQPLVRGRDETRDWLLAPEEEIVNEAMKLVPSSIHRLLQLSLRAVMEEGESCLSDGECSYVHTYAGVYITRVKEQAGQLATHWLH